MIERINYMMRREREKESTLPHSLTMLDGVNFNIDSISDNILEDNRRLDKFQVHTIRL